MPVALDVVPDVTAAALPIVLVNVLWNVLVRVVVCAFAVRTVV